MLDRILNEPWSFWGGLVIWLPLSIWIVCLVGWMITGEIGVLHGLLGVATAVALGALTLSPPDRSMPPFILGAVTVTTIAFPAVRHGLQRRALSLLDAEVVERAYQALMEKPTNVGSEIKIASILYDRGLPGHAIGIVERVASSMASGVFRQELAAMAATWRTRTSPDRLEAVVHCASCGRENEPGPVHCPGCGAPFLLHYLRGGLLTGPVAGKLLLLWTVSLVGAMGMVWASLRLAPGPAVGCLAGICVGLVGIFWSVLRRRAPL